VQLLRKFIDLIWTLLGENDELYYWSFVGVRCRNILLLVFSDLAAPVSAFPLIVRPAFIEEQRYSLWLFGRSTTAPPVFM